MQIERFIHRMISCFLWVVQCCHRTKSRRPVSTRSPYPRKLKTGRPNDFDRPVFLELLAFLFENSSVVPFRLSGAVPLRSERSVPDRTARSNASERQHSACVGKRSEAALWHSADKLSRSEFYLAEGQRLAHMGSWSFTVDGNRECWPWGAF